MKVKIHTCQLIHGIVATPVTVLVETTPDDAFEIVGLAEHAARELRVRVRSALEVCLPGETRGLRVHFEGLGDDGRGSVLDLAVAAGILAVRGWAIDTHHALYFGELALNGTVREPRGRLAAMKLARESGRVLVTAPGAALDFGPVRTTYRTVTRVEDIAWGDAVLGSMHRTHDAIPARVSEDAPRLEDLGPALRDIAEDIGREIARGARRILLVGVPGSGKTVLARRLPGLLPALSDDERREVALIQDAAGLEPTGERPFRAPHHTASQAALVGGGKPIRPGELTLAHRGVLMLDEIDEFRAGDLDAVLRAHATGAGVAKMPADTIIVGAMNPIPEGTSAEARASIEERHATIRRRFDAMRGLPPYDVATHVAVRGGAK